MSIARRMKRAAARAGYRRGQALIDQTPLTPVEEVLAGTFKPDKGEKNGSCNLTACQRPGADWFNYSTRRYYCRVCAHALNAANRQDALRIYGHDLCLWETEATDAE